MSERNSLILGIVFFLICVVMFGVAIYAHFFAPCDSWLMGITPAKDLPGRCILR